MLAVIKTGGKQYTVQPDTVIRVEKLETQAGETVTIEDVLLINDGKKTTVGEPLVKGAKVVAEVVRQMRDRKVLVFKKIRRHNYRRKKGHRQHLTVLKIKSISAA